jgi:uncharacterized protein YcgL (UPF0745 family)
MGFEISTFKIGKAPNQKLYTIHKDLFRKVGGKLRKQSKHLKQTQIIDIAEVAPSIFDILVLYLYINTIPPVSNVSDTATKSARVRDLCMFYVFLEKMKVNNELLNKVMDGIQDGFFMLDLLPEPQFCKEVFKHTSANSQLRKFCSISVVAEFYQLDQTPEILFDWLKTDEDALSNFLEAVRWLERGRDSRIRDPCDDPSFSGITAPRPGLWPCTFHVHTMTELTKKPEDTEDAKQAMKQDGSSESEKIRETVMERCHLLC